jgi:glycosyltransferase involved in cell wall biosynthesis
MKLSIIICTKNPNINQLYDCLVSVRKQSWVADKIQNRDYEILIIDDYSTIESQTQIQYLAEEWFSARYYYNWYYPGLPSARNYGIAQSRGNIILFLDDDVILDKNYIKEIMKAFSFPFVGGATGNLETHRPQRPKIFELIMQKYAKLFNFSGFFANQSDIGKVHSTGFVSGNFDKVPLDKLIYPTQWLSGCNMAYRHNEIKNRYFDNDYKGHQYYEDADFSYRLYKNHKRLYIVSRAKLIHTTNNKNLATKKYWQLINCHRFFKENVYDGNFRSLIKHYITMWSLFIPVLGYSISSKNINLIKQYLRAQWRLLKK